ncbi:YceI family protein [Litorimonas sp. RW-G-Af-16]|uniref:YceI family protein n=1 Tax=Litorimonas sp. RW-G-Af-16 TaxID=3241168 RepID=UPI00390C9E1A
MMIKHIFLAPAAIVLLGCISPAVQQVSAAPSGNYKLDPTHASVNWSLSHAGLSQYTARFDSISGALEFNQDAPETSRIDIRIDPRSVSTGLPDFDETLATSANYFDADSYPEIRYVSAAIVKTGDNRGTVTGDLTLRGVTKPVTLDVVFNGAGKSFGNPGKTLGFSATGTFNRSDFGMDYLITLGNIGDKISLNIQAEFNEAQ